MPPPADGQQYLRDFLKIAPLSHAAFRAVEALAFSQIELEHPVLDLGCGFGEFAGVVFEQLEMGIDVSESDLDLGRQSDKYQRMFWSDARRMPFQSGAFATVVSVSVLEHIHDVPRALAEASRVLRPGGMLAITVPTGEMYRNLFFPNVLRLVGLPGLARWYIRGHRAAFKHVTVRSLDWWKEQLHKAGFEMERCEGTISPAVMRLHDFFLLTAFPSQLAKWITGRRLLTTTGLRSKLLPLLFGRFVRLDRESEINLFIAGAQASYRLMDLLILNGPNLNMLGIREPEVYGRLTLDDLNARLEAIAADLGARLEFFQSNHEGALIDRIHAGHGRGLVGAIINPGGLTHTSISLHDAIKSVDYPFVEVHLSNVARREPFRAHSYVAPAAIGTIAGLGWRGYAAALRILVELAGERATS